MNFYESNLEELRAQCNLRSIPADTSSETLIDLSGNDYLGIADDKALQQEFFDSFRDSLPSMSASASRLLASGQKEFEALEQTLSELYGAPALLFNSGYHANTGAVAALAKGRTLILADKLVHASIIDGIMLSKADFARFRHNDADHLQRLLAQRAANYERVLIICESVYSMDGDTAPLDEIIAAKTPNSILYVDEAHAFGVCGPDGLGLAANRPGVDIIVGTLGKAAASVGAFIICRMGGVREYLVNNARSLIFSTAIPPINCAWSRFIIERIPSMGNRRKRLAQLSETLADILGSSEPSHIQPLIIGSSKGAIEKSCLLRRRGFKVLPIRTPTVPPGTERLRFSLSAALTPEMLQPLKEALR